MQVSLSFINDSLLQPMQYLNQPLLQFADIMDIIARFR